MRRLHRSFALLLIALPAVSANGAITGNCAICEVGGVKPHEVAGYTCRDTAGALLGDSNSPDFAALPGIQAPTWGRSLGKLQASEEYVLHDHALIPCNIA